MPQHSVTADGGPDEAVVVPVHLLTGFLGSGKTTLLTRLLDYYRETGRKAAVIMNELGDVNLDGQLVGDEVPMSELLGGCICCTGRGDLGLEIHKLMEEHRPDVILIESTGAANPMEILDGITEAAFYDRVELGSVIAVVDGPGLIAQAARGKGRTYKLMRDQIRCATRLIVNKSDRLAPDELVLAEQTVREWNPHAPLEASVRCTVDPASFDADAVRPAAVTAAHEPASSSAAEGQPPVGDYGEGGSSPVRGQGRHGRAPLHGSHGHVVAVTHYFSQPVDSVAFEAFLAALPDNVYRAKGILAFTDTAGGRFLFQYAYRETDFLRITPQGKVNDVAVFIGENLCEESLRRDLAELENPRVP
ncbi:MAG TPA: GTP-binding protein [Paenibacillus sp.]|uniref:CobW family GTP-binding protein n=1 Tax=Paenibacillus sp. TaxID=58172 RepID=UPI002C260CCB|nr:GTP-binding protein [Paenibacillus sp.]HUC93059.1 GTP-binding protein [Paenibacillus sp.]